MVLYGYDASVYNSVLGSDNWLKWMNVYPQKNVSCDIVAHQFLVWSQWLIILPSTVPGHHRCSQYWYVNGAKQTS